MKLSRFCNLIISISCFIIEILVHFGRKPCLLAAAQVKDDGLKRKITSHNEVNCVTNQDINFVYVFRL